MAKSDLTELLPTGLKEANVLLEALGIYDKLKDFIGRAKAYPVVFLGASGTGKTALLRSLAGLPPFVRREARTDSVQPAINKLGSLFIEVIDTPGEEDHIEKRKALYRELPKKGSVGVVNVVSYGFHEGKALQARAITEGHPSEDFLAARRKSEMNQIKEWVGPYCGRGGCIDWILTVVTKADLWWEAGVDQPVLQYYDSPTYTDAFSASDGVPHSIKPFSSLNHLFYDMAPMSGFYSDARRKEDQATVLVHILQKATEHG